MIKGFLNFPWLVWAAGALLIAVVFSSVWPHKAATVQTGFRFFIIRWGHALTWLLLAINFVLRGISPSLNAAADLVALAGGIFYFLFLFTSFVMK